MAEKVATDFSRIPTCPTFKHGKRTNSKWCSSTEFLIHQMASSVTLTAATNSTKHSNDYLIY